MSGDNQACFSLNWRATLIIYNCKDMKNILYNMVCNYNFHVSLGLEAAFCFVMVRQCSRLVLGN